MTYTVYNSVGRILSIEDCAEADIAGIVTRLGGAGYIAGYFSWDTHRVSGGQPVEFPAKPSPRHQWDWATQAWADPRTLEQAKTTKVEEMRDARDAQINGTFTWDGSAFDADQVSQTRILGLKVDSGVEGFTPKSWRLADNTWRTLSAADAAGVWAALRTHLANHFATFAERDAAIAAAATIAEVDAITWAAP